jgi:hypothetical protein
MSVAKTYRALAEEMRWKSDYWALKALSAGMNGDGALVHKRADVMAAAAELQRISSERHYQWRLAERS